MAQEFDDEWKLWIRTNVERGCAKDGIFKILADEGFDYDAIKSELNHEPSVSLDQIRNPLLAASERAGSDQSGRADAPEPGGARIYLPHAQRVETGQAEIYLVEHFLSREECGRLTDIIRSRLRPSTITNPDEADKEFRTSRTCDLPIADPFVREIDERICRYLGINPSYSEHIQGQHYEAGEQFKPHTDFFGPSELEQYGDSQGQRTWTFMVYLNEPGYGGATLFPYIGRSFKPCGGRALIWNNLHSDGRPNPATQHYGTPVEAGTKTIITKWFREKGEGDMYTKEANESIPSLTATGFDKARIPRGLYQQLLDYYREHASEATREVVEGYIDGPGDTASELIELPDALRSEVHAALLPELEQWSGIELEPTFVYGIRRYKDGATLKPHRDRIGTHIVSAVLNLEQDVDEDWPLEIEDHYYRAHQVSLSPGEMLLYEGGRLRHGRPGPLRGRSYSNIFVHYRPRGG